jgi:hypothetical protein
MLDSNSSLIDEFIKRGRQDLAMTFCCSMILDAYYTMNKPEWINQENVAYRDHTERHFADYFKKWKSLWNMMPDQNKMVMSNQIRQRSIAEGMQFEAITIDAWLKRITKLRK